MAGKKRGKLEISWGNVIFIAICIGGILFGVWYVIFVMRRTTIDQIHLSYLMPRSLSQKEFVYDDGTRFGGALFTDGKKSKPHGSSTEEWIYAPAYIAVDDSGELLRFHEDGYIRSVYSTDKTIKRVEGPDVLMFMPEKAVIYKLRFNLYGEDAQDEFEAEYPDDDPSNEKKHNKRMYVNRWCAYMGQEDSKRAYIFTMDADKYSKAEFLFFLHSIEME